MSAIEVTSLSQASVAEDFSFAEVTFTAQSGESLVSRFKPKALETIVAQLAQVLAHIRNNTVSEGGVSAPPITLASDATAAAALEGSHVVLSVRGANGVVFHFAIESEIATRLRSEIETAENSVREQVSHTRQ